MLHTIIDRIRAARLAPLLLALASPGLGLAAPNTQTPIAGSKIPQFAQPLPLLSFTPGSGMFTIVPGATSAAAPLQLSFCEFQAKVLPPGTFAAGQQPLTWVWGYIQGPTCPTTPQDTYIGPVLVNTRGTPTSIRYTNSLPRIDQTNVLAYKLSTDQTLHWADPLGGEQNMCHMMGGNPPQVNVGIPAYKSECSLNFGEWWDPATLTGGFNPVGIAAVPHLHGGEVPPVIDGGPDAWFTSLNSNGTVEKGHDFYSNPNAVGLGPNEALYTYPNSQGAAPLWFHDHTLGATRLNVYAGLAGAYYILDPAQEAWFAAAPPAGISMLPVTKVVPIVLQDRMFDVNGQLYFPTDFPGGINGPSPNPQHPYWNPEFVGDTVVINGKVWPFMQVEPRRYRFLFLNGSNARAYEMFLVNSVTKLMGPGVWVIGNDAGFLDWAQYVDPNAVKPAQNHLIMQPGERYEVIIDFTQYAGQTLVLKNVGKAPFPGGKAPQGSTTGQLMQFRVNLPLSGTDTSYDPATNQPGLAGAMPIRPTPMLRLATNGVANVTPAKVRLLTLNEVALLPQTATDPVTGVLNTMYPGGPVEILVNNSLWTGDSTRPYGDFIPVTINGITERISETPKEGDIELWEIVNATMDAHPIHTHLASFQILNRQNFDGGKFMAAYGAGFTKNLPAGCTAGLPCAGYGPPYSYDPAANPFSGGKWGGNPDVALYLQGPIKPPDPSESGWKDTFIVYPGMVNRFLVRWAPQETPLGTVAGYPFSPNDSPTGAVGDSHGYVWHCHIIDHEDNEMMRPDVIIPLAVPRQIVKGVDY